MIWSFVKWGIVIAVVLWAAHNPAAAAGDIRGWVNSVTTFLSGLAA